MSAVPPPASEPDGEQPPRHGDGAPSGAWFDCMRYDGADGDPALYALAEQAATDPATLTGDELLTMVSSARRLAARAQYLELTAVAEFTRRTRATCEASAAGGNRPGRRAAEFAVSELAFELVATDHAAEDRMDLAAALTTRLPATFAGLGEGTIDGDKAWAVWYNTRFLSDADAAYADAEPAKAAPAAL